MLNHRVLLLLLLGSVKAEVGCGQATTAATAAIQTQYQRISSNRATYKTRSISLDGESGEGGQGTAYYEGKEMKLLAVVHYEEMGKREAHYYYHNGQVFFALSSLYRYNRPIYYDKKTARNNGDPEAFDLKKAELTENRYYFQNGKLIRWLNSAKKPQPVAAATKNEDYQLLIADEARVRAAFAR
ncbi:hypothetical protein HHL22_04455 [Hymenobacter sp. RP-2-7]|uniref:Uncharacterized protein n=1 Tax=Hymenobacter polaris TaxID=2682546 RepID=A0A7Y0ABQ5_9BACT|nr:hypothetical protein [Hymenobacter polaris]NML64451.1 hypothetical protein [Hymenobacter polaris]